MVSDGFSSLQTSFFVCFAIDCASKDLLLSRWVYRELVQDPEELSPPGGNSSAILTSSSTAPSAEKARNQTKPTTVDNNASTPKCSRNTTPQFLVCVFSSPQDTLIL